jgi:hypothetical protein
LQGKAALERDPLAALFTLGDADSSKDDLFHRFGVLRSDCSPKTPLHTLSRLIAEVG